MLLHLRAVAVVVPQVTRASPHLQLWGPVASVPGARLALPVNAEAVGQQPLPEHPAVVAQRTPKPEQSPGVTATVSLAVKILGMHGTRLGILAVGCAAQIVSAVCC